MLKLLMPIFFIMMELSFTQGAWLIRGLVRDVETGQGLAAASIQIEGSYKGAITNDDGKFFLNMEKLPATLLIQYIGYHPQSVSIDTPADSEWVVSLTPAPIIMREIVVDGEDPAIKLMRKVIAKKKEWWINLLTYKAEAYTRMNLANDSSIVVISETISELYWDHTQGAREIIKSKRQTANLDPKMNFAAAIDFPNFYHDDIQLAGFQIINVIHPDALKHYQFKIIGERRLHDQTIYELSVKPGNRLQPLFEGTISVLDGEYALLSVDLKPAENVIFPMPIQKFDVYYKQQFSNFGGDFWLPVSLVSEGQFKIGFTGLQFPPFYYKRVYEIRDYQINLEMPDSIFKQDKKVRVDSGAVKSNSGFATINETTVPLSIEEEAAYETIDSNLSIIQAFKPTGFLARFAKVEVQDNDGNSTTSELKEKNKKIKFTYSPQLWFNRVDGLHLALKNSVKILDKIKFKVLAGYNAASGDWSYGGGLELGIISLDYSINSDTRYQSELYQRSVSSLGPLLGYDDYYDYYRNEKLRSSFRYKVFKINSMFELGINREIHSSMEKKTDYNILGRNYIQRINPAIDEGNLRSFDLTFQYGDNFIPYGLMGQKRAVVTIEHSSKDLLASDFSYTKYQLSIDWRFRTFLKRRMLSNALDVRIVVGTCTGNLPLQKFGILESSRMVFSAFGAFKSATGRPIEGEKYFAVFWEHNFRTVPFELLGMMGIARKGTEIILHGGSGRTWINKDRLSQMGYLPRYRDGFQHEIGLSINKIFNIIRLDLTVRLDQSGFFITFSAPRFF